MTPRTWCALGPVILAACTQAVEPATEVVVRIDSDLAPGNELVKVSIALLQADGTDAGARRLPEVFVAGPEAPTPAVGAIRVALPISFSITRGRARNMQVQVIGWGTRAGEDGRIRKLVEQRANASFRDETTQLVQVFLGEVCVDASCGDDASQVCYPTAVAGTAAGACGDVDALSQAITSSNVRPSDLPELIARIDAPAMTVPVDDAGSVDPRDGAVDDAGEAPDAASRDADTPRDAGGDAGPAPSACAGANLCSVADYPCEEASPRGYTCRGQFSDWPMPDRVAGSKFIPAFDVDTVAEVARDTVTGLWWQRNLPATYDGCTGQAEPGQGRDGDGCTRSQAQAYCAGLVLGGHDDWRLPSKIELESIIDETRVAPGIDQEVFPATPAGLFWTSSPYVAAQGPGWVVNFFTGNSGANVAANPNRVRCVRADPLQTSGVALDPATRYGENTTSGVVSDTRTGLVWQRAVSPNTHPWESAKSYCAGLGGGFRLPSLKELLTLVDPTRSAPSASAVLSDTPSEPFWTASPWLYQPGNAWSLNFDDGTSVGASVEAPYRVRCVR